jgi:catechol 2,3-dioxygenase
MTSIAAQTRMGAVTLDVADVELVSRFYTEGVGLSVVAEDPGGLRSLGRGNTVLMNLRHSPSLKHAGPSEAGLFHTAILFDDKAFLAASVVNVAQLFPRSFTGSSDHRVSEAFYFNDPEGNGVELYWDRPRDAWLVSNGEIQMDTLYLDPNRFIQQHATDESMSGHGTGAVRVGHVHLSVGNISAAQEFYVNHLGFDQTFEWNKAAVFVSAGGYHHHMAMNIWRSNGAGVRQPTLGLGILEIDLPTADDLGTTLEGLRDNGHLLRDTGSAVEVDDPWGNVVRLALAS